MSKLYPPYIEGTIPAFYGDTIKVPFTMNPAVSKNEVAGFALKIKNINTNDELDNITIDIDESFWNGDYIVEFSWASKTKIIGNSYKLQLAYINKFEKDGKEVTEIGYYSTVGIVKYTHEPNVEIINNNSNNNNQIMGNVNHTEFYGRYTSQDLTEKVYSYQFDLYNSQGNLFESSGEILHNNEEGTSLITNSLTTYIECKNKYLVKKQLDYNESYTISYSITTVNGLTYSASPKMVQNTESVSSILKCAPEVKLDVENGRVEISFHPDEHSMLSGKFYLLRSSSKDNFNHWDQIHNFVFNNQITSNWKWYDYTVEHGVEYIYAFQQYNSHGVVSREKRAQNSIIAEFDSMFLYDGIRQLKINFNPKVSSFKINILESKNDTIGGQFPYFFRNGSVSYKEFPISGLISYQSDNDELFMSKEELGLAEPLVQRPQGEIVGGAWATKTPTTNLLSYNFDAERIFKQKVLEFLTDGKPKLFRSASEGSYIVRLMNTSLSPNDTLGRMLHTFSSTAYETANMNYDNLVKYGMIDIEPKLNQEMYKWETIDLRNCEEGTNLLADTAYSINCEDLPKGTILYIDGEPIQISKTGQYRVDRFIKPFNELKVKFPNIDTEPEGLITCAYRLVGSTVFDQYVKIEEANIIQEFIGSELTTDNKNLITQLAPRDSKQRSSYEISGFYFIKFEKWEIDGEPKDNDYKVEIKITDSVSEEPIELDIGKIGQWYGEKLDPVSSIQIGRGIKATVAARRTKITYEEE